MCWAFKTNIGHLNKRNGWGNVKKRNEHFADGSGNSKATLVNSLPVYRRSAAFV
jgi:hypothetical protein